MNTRTKSNHLERKYPVYVNYGDETGSPGPDTGSKPTDYKQHENSEVVENHLLPKIAKALEVSVEGIKNFSEETCLI